MVNRVAAESLQARQYFHHYTEDALDLCDVLEQISLEFTHSPRA
jgi:hypothetical protein